MTLYEILQSKKSGSSGTGGSYYEAGSTCGMKARLQTLFPYEEPENEGNELTPTGKRKANGRRAGSFYHTLQEMWRTDTLPTDVMVSADAMDYDFELALNSFHKYRQRFDDDRHNLGTVVSAEKRIPDVDADGNLTPLGEQQQALIKEFTGGAPFSLRYDLLTDLSQDDVYKIAIERAVALPGPGRYLIDYKLVSGIASSTMWSYSFDFQALSYPVIYNLCHPDAPVKGMITDVMARVLKPEPRHFALYLAYADPNASHIVRDSIRYSAGAHQKGEANARACIGKWGPCYFLTTGACPRYGAFDDFDFTSGRGVPKVMNAQPES